MDPYVPTRSERPGMFCSPLQTGFGSVQEGRDFCVCFNQYSFFVREVVQGRSKAGHSKHPTQTGANKINRLTYSSAVMEGSTAMHRLGRRPTTYLEASRACGAYHKIAYRALGIEAHLWWFFENVI